MGCYISVVRTTASGKGPGATLTLGNAPYRLQRVQFVGSQLTIFAALLRTMDRSNAKLDERAKLLFYIYEVVFARC